MHLLFLVCLIEVLTQEHGAYGESTCSLHPIDRKARKLEYIGRYYLGEAAVSQSEADECCKSKHLTLAMISSDEESALVSRLHTLAPAESDDSPNATGRHVWMSSDIKIVKNMAKIGDGPCSSIAIQAYLGDLVQIEVEGSACDAKKSFLCEDKDAGKVQLDTVPAGSAESTDLYSSKMVSWTTARTYCDSKGKSLINTLTTKQKGILLPFILSTAEGKAGVWTGAFFYPIMGFRWSNRDKITVPIEGKENTGNRCIKLTTNGDIATYATEDCATNLPFICTDNDLETIAFSSGSDKPTTFEERVIEFGGAELNDKQKADCLKEEPNLIETTKNLYCMHLNLTWRQSLMCCELKGMFMASYRSTDERLPVFSCSNVVQTEQRKDYKYTGPWTTANNFQFNDYHWYNTSDVVKEDIWVDPFYFDDGIGSCVLFHGTKKTQIVENSNSQSPLCKDGICWGLITESCLRQTYFVCQKLNDQPSMSTTIPPQMTSPMPPQETTPMPPQETTPIPPQVTTPMPPQETTPMPPQVTTPMPPQETTPIPPQVTTPMPPQETTPMSPQETTPMPPQETTPMPPQMTTPMPPSMPTPDPSKCPPRPTMRSCNCKEGLTLTENRDVIVETKFGVTYAIGKTKETFFQSIQECKKLNMTFLAIEFPAENTLVGKHRKALDADLWTSGVTTKSGRLIQWMGTGRYLHFHPNGWKPDVSEDKCLAIDSEGKWIVSDCGTKNYYMCEFRQR